MASRPTTTVERTYVAYYVPSVQGAQGHDQVVLKHPNGLCVVCLAPGHPMCLAARGVGESGGRAGDTDAGCTETTGGKRKRDEGAAGVGEEGGVKPGETSEVLPSVLTEAPAVVVSARPEDDDGPSIVGGGAKKQTSAPTTYAPTLTAVDFSCGKGNNNNVQVSGKKKRGAKVLMENSGVARLTDARGNEWTARACLRGKLLETNDRLSRDPSLAVLDSANTGFLCILEPRPEDLGRLVKTALAYDDYRALLEKRKLEREEKV
jgi:hypothetical protein